MSFDGNEPRGVSFSYGQWSRRPGVRAGVGEPQREALGADLRASAGAPSAPSPSSCRARRCEDAGDLRCAACGSPSCLVRLPLGPCLRVLASSARCATATSVRCVRLMVRQVAYRRVPRRRSNIRPTSSRSSSRVQQHRHHRLHPLAAVAEADDVQPVHVLVHLALANREQLHVALAELRSRSCRRRAGWRAPRRSGRRRSGRPAPNRRRAGPPCGRGRCGSPRAAPAAFSITYFMCMTPKATWRLSSCAARRNMRLSTSLCANISPMRNIDCTKPSPTRCSVEAISVKSCASAGRWRPGRPAAGRCRSPARACGRRRGGALRP